LYQAVLADARFHEQLLVFDRDLSAIAQAAGCGQCGGAVHAAPFGRKPRGGPAGLGRDYARRFSFCCAVDGCRKRKTPPSLRFLGWRSSFTEGTFAQLAKASFMPPVDIASLPASLLDRFAGTAAERLIALLRLLTPLTAGTATMRVF
jgi:hypothetical protein